MKLSLGAQHLSLCEKSKFYQLPKLQNVVTCVGRASRVQPWLVLVLEMGQQLWLANYQEEYSVGTSTRFVSGSFRLFKIYGIF